MTTYKNSILFFLILLFSFASNVHAEETNVHDVVRFSVQKVLLVLKEERDTFEENPDRLMAKILRVTEPVVAFDSIARSVMGKYKKQATIKQKNDFAKVFKDTMIKLYVKALIAFESEDIIILPPEPGKIYTKKAKVPLNVTSIDGTLYKVIYSMRKNKKGQWQAKNMIVDGINLGLTYLNQFDSAMNRYNQDMDKVIESWQQDMSTASTE